MTYQKRFEKMRQKFVPRKSSTNLPLTKILFDAKKDKGQTINDKK